MRKIIILLLLLGVGLTARAQKVISLNDVSLSLNRIPMMLSWLASAFCLAIGLISRFGQNCCLR